MKSHFKFSYIILLSIPLLLLLPPFILTLYGIYFGFIHLSFIIFIFSLPALIFEVFLFKVLSFIFIQIKIVGDDIYIRNSLFWEKTKLKIKDIKYKKYIYYNKANRAFDTLSILYDDKNTISINKQTTSNFQEIENLIVENCVEDKNMKVFTRQLGMKYILLGALVLIVFFGFTKLISLFVN